MSKNTIKTIRTVTPCYAYWFADAPKPLSDAFFDITDPATYPAQLKNINRTELNRLLDRLKPTGYSLWAIPSASADQLEDINKLVNFLRYHYNSRFDTRVIPIDYQIDDRVYYKNVDKKLLTKRLLFLHLAKQVVAGFETTSSIARKFGINKINVAIWVSILLAFGEQAFFKVEPEVTREYERKLADFYRTSGKSKVWICAQNRFFCYKRLKQILRRNPPL